MMAAITAAESGNRVILIDKSEKLGKKLFLTGKGRCNITNNSANADFFENIVTNPKFLYSAYVGFDSMMLQEFLKANGLKLKVERGSRVFPASDRSSDVTKVLKKILTRLEVEILLRTEVTEIITKAYEAGTKKDSCKHKITGVILKNNQQLKADKLIIATGGMSYPATGSTGDGFRFAASTGHKILTPSPALVGLKVKETWREDLQGLSLKNITVAIESPSKVIYKGFGEMLFTHFGLSGPLILSASSFYAKHLSAIEEPEKITAVIDLKPALSFEKLDQRLLRDFEKGQNKYLKSILVWLLPNRMIGIILRRSRLAPDKIVNKITKEERHGLVKMIKGFTLEIKGSLGFKEAIITQGGVNVKDINPKTMESKLVKGLYFAGEVIDVDALTGGYNLQIAWSTGYLAGKSAGGDIV